MTTLSVGTALQNGNYVIDAFCFTDALGPVYRATQVITGQVVQLRALSQPAENEQQSIVWQPEIGSQFQHYLTQINQLHHPHLARGLSSFVEGDMYLVIEGPVGQPLSDRVLPQAPLTLRSALQALHQIRSALEALRPLGWAGLSLQPEQVGLQDRRLILSGFGLPPASIPYVDPFPDADIAVDPAVSLDSISEAALVQQLAQLLYFLLTGERPEAVAAPLVHLRHRYPGLPAELESAIASALPQSNQSDSALTLAGWMQRLPKIPEAAPAAPPAGYPTPAHTTAAAPVDQAEPPAEAATAAASAPSRPSPQVLTTAVPRPTPRSSPSRPGRWSGRSIGLAVTALAAAIAGLGFGLALRLGAPVTVGGARLSPEQAFPPLPDWEGDDPVAEFDTPYVPDQPAPPAREAEPRRELPATEPIETPFEPAPVVDTPPVEAIDSPADLAPESEPDEADEAANSLPPAAPPASPPPAEPPSPMRGTGEPPAPLTPAPAPPKEVPAPADPASGFFPGPTPAPDPSASP